MGKNDGTRRAALGSPSLVKYVAEGKIEYRTVQRFFDQYHDENGPPALCAVIGSLGRTDSTRIPPSFIDGTFQVVDERGAHEMLRLMLQLRKLWQAAWGRDYQHNCLPRVIPTIYYHLPYVSLPELARRAEKHPNLLATVSKVPPCLAILNDIWNTEELPGNKRNWVDEIAESRKKAMRRKARQKANR